MHSRNVASRIFDATRVKQPGSSSLWRPPVLVPALPALAALSRIVLETALQSVSLHALRGFHLTQINARTTALLVVFPMIFFEMEMLRLILSGNFDWTSDRNVASA